MVILQFRRRCNTFMWVRNFSHLNFVSSNIASSSSSDLVVTSENKMQKSGENKLIKSFRPISTPPNEIE